MCPSTRVLVVEDDHELRSTLADVLADQGYEVSCASNGREALDRLAGGLPRPDVILLDLVMPVMDGFAFRDAQRGQPNLADIPTVVLSASYPPDSARISALGARAVLAKPVGIDRLISALERLAPRPRTLPH
ncbi:MAG TPA: response regulator [Anaeromyxobacter sp.]|nr:response regulator [Anaeromyxobacter sp.]